MTSEYGALSLIPPLLVIVLAIRLRTSFEPLLLGCLTGFVIISLKGGPDFFSGFVEALYKVMMDKETIWVILVCGLYGSLIGLLMGSGAAQSFAGMMLKNIPSRRTALLSTWLLGIVLFLDDYLSALTTGSTMKRVTDTFRISRELLAYIVNATAASVCVIVPLSTWTLFIGSILEECGFAASGTGNIAYWSVIPYVLYGWISVLLVPVVVMGWLPLFGRMRKAELHAPQRMQAVAASPASHLFRAQPAAPMYFLIPLAVLLLATFFLDFDALKGVMIAVLFTFLFYLFRRIASFRILSETVFSGFNSMVYALALLVMSYVLKEVGDQMGLTSYVIEKVQPLISGQMLPAVLFLAMGMIAWATGSSWGLYAVVIPLVIPLAQSCGAHILLTLGAVVSAGVFGANACLFSDATILTAQATETNNVEHALSQLPYTLCAFTVSLLLYLFFGFVL
ncbi:MAG: Na+/H+ antiporter NhaC family protein [Chitinophagales bacterium]|nr:hypothetical protein [Chitinophagales bacterium]MDW8394211.1 Na+/H+ antiporter NhaC family protein [Chitinophagales bacterium]